MHEEEILYVVLIRLDTNTVSLFALQEFLVESESFSNLQANYVRRLLRMIRRILEAPSN